MMQSKASPASSNTARPCLSLVVVALIVAACNLKQDATSPRRDASPGADARDAGTDGISADLARPEAGNEAPPDLSPTRDATDDPTPQSDSDARDGAPADLGPDAGPDLGSDASPDAAPSCVTTPAPQAKFPFPQNRFGSYCIKPTYSNDDVQRAYCQWKNDTVTTSGVGGCPKGGCYRVKRPNDAGLDKDSTVSEGIAYGMLIAVVMNDQKLFDGLWKYEQQFLDQYGLMNWYIKADGSGTANGGGGAATDADEDMAFALLMADKQWGGQGSLDKSYLDYAKGEISAIWEHEIVDSKGVKPGDTWGDWSSLNISYFAPSYYRTFATVDSGHPWAQVATASYDVIDNTLNAANGNQSNGLVPAWISCGQTSCSPNPNAWGDKPGQSPTNYQYDSCRTPFRIGIDYCWNGNSRAKDYVAKTSAFFSGIGASKIVDGYDLNGSPKPATSGKSAAFIGTAAVGAMSSSSYLSFVNDAYASVATLQDLTGGTYYEDSWTVLSLLAMTGNFFDYTAPPSN